MKLRESIKSRICLPQMVPNYPLGEFVRWAESRRIDNALLSVLLDDIQHELEAEAVAFRHFAMPSQSMCGYWCLYCEQVRAYYKAIIRNPDCKDELSFLLR